jgi:hypothetical protein
VRCGGGGGEFATARDAELTETVADAVKHARNTAIGDSMRQALTHPRADAGHEVALEVVCGFETPVVTRASASMSHIAF